MKFDDFENVVKGHQTIDGKTGGGAIASILKKIDVKAELASLKKELPKLRGTNLDKANRKVKYLNALDQLGLRADQAYIMNHVPVLPPIFRPITTMPTGALRFDDINHHYKSLGHINTQLKTRTKDLPDELNQDLREQLYDVVKSLQGLGGAPVTHSNRKMKGILDQLAGDSPKMGQFQRRVMKRRQELSMRSTIIPEPEMHLDHVGIPRDAALELYKPFVVREMQSLGYSPIEGLKAIKDQTDLAWKALQLAMDKRPIFLKRDPALHKFSIMAFKPQLVNGKAIKIHPLVTAGYNADFDGDTMSAFVPLTDDAIREAHKMFPSNNLFSSTHGGIMYAPDQESLLGLNLLSKWGKASGKTFNSLGEAQKALNKDQIHVTDVITVGGKKTTIGRLIIGQHLPDSVKDPEIAKMFQDPEFELVKHTKSEHRLGVHDLLESVAKKDPKNFATTVDRLKDLGNKYSYELGFSFGLNDLTVHKETRAKIMDKADAKAADIKKSDASNPDKDAQLIEVYTKATKDLEKAHEPLFREHGNKIFQMVESGARGKMSQFRQMTIAPMLMQDGSGRTLPTPVKKSYSEGLDIGDYWTALHGARKGTLQRVEGTSEPGSLTKEIVNVVIPNMVMSKDCGTTQGVSMDLHDDDIHDRFLAAPVTAGNQTIKAGTLIDSHVTSLLKRHKVNRVVVRSPLKCAHAHGLCSKCYGLNENGELHELGTNVGVIAGHAMGEPATQLAMDSFHTGGVAASRGGGSGNKFDRLKQLLEIPKILPNAATLSRISGTIEKVEKDTSTNGHNIFVGGEKHFVPAQRQPEHDGKPLTAGMQVRKGDPLSDGNINPRELLQLTDIHNVQNYLTNELYNSIYKDERVRKRNIETVVRSLTNLTRVKEPGSSDLTHGDVVLRTVVEAQNKAMAKGEQPIIHEPLLRRAQDVALDQHEDWMARLNFQNLRRTILEGTAKGWRSNLHGHNPIPSYAHGAEFGKGTSEKPYLY
jgi:DNA-directed RNA polymerase subunit beta'